MATVAENILSALEAFAKGSAEGIATAVSVWDTARQSIRTVAAGVSAAAMQGELNKVAATYQDVPLTPAVLADMSIRNIDPGFDIPTEASYSGLDATRFAALVEDTGESYGIVDALRLWHRGTYLRDIVDTSATGSGADPFVFGESLGTTYGITEDELEKVIHYSRVRDQFIPDLLKLSWQTMSPADAVEVAIKGRMSPADAQVLYEAAGGMPEQFDLLYAAAGDSIGVETAVMLHHRGYITDAELTDVLYQSRINPRFYPVAELQYLHFLAPYQIQQALSAGVIDADTANAWMLASGYPADQAAAFASTAAGGKVSSAKAETEGMVLADFEAQIITEDEATSALTSLGYVPTAIPFVLESVIARRVISMRNSAITRLRTGFVAGDVTSADATTELGLLGIASTAVTAFLEAWTIEASIVTKRLTAAQVGKLAEDGNWTAEQAVAYWEKLGYSATDAMTLLLIYPAGEKAPPNAAVAADPTAITADGRSTSTLTVQAYAAGEPATSSQGAVTLAASLGTVGPVTDRGNGTYVATFTAGTTAGTAEISGTIAGAPIGEGTSIVLNAAPATTGGT